MICNPQLFTCMFFLQIFVQSQTLHDDRYLCAIFIHILDNFICINLIVIKVDNTIIPDTFSTAASVGVGPGTLMIPDPHVRNMVVPYRILVQRYHHRRLPPYHHVGRLAETLFTSYIYLNNIRYHAGALIDLYLVLDTN